jgi:uncharacterized membrane protein YeaQ/YmgE (transglycosylase-associated protein family)
MSVMHILGGVFVGLLTGRIFGMFTLRKVKGGKLTFMAVGVAGSLGADLLFKILYDHDLVSNFFYAETTIIVEMVIGAVIACYAVNLLGKNEEITF